MCFIWGTIGVLTVLLICSFIFDTSKIGFGLSKDLIYSKSILSFGFTGATTFMLASKLF